MSDNRTESKNYHKQFFSGVAVLAISTFIVKLIGLFYKIPMMAYLGAEGMGYFNSAYDIYTLFFVISTTGIPVAISILIAENKTQGRLKNIRKIFKISLIVLGTLGLIGTLSMGIFFDEFSRLIHNNEAKLCILAISPTVLMICLSSAIRGYFQGNQIMLPTAISQVIESLGKLILGLWFAIIAINKGYDTPIIAAYAVFGLTLGVAISLLFLSLYKLFYRIKIGDQTLSTHTDSTNRIVKNLFAIAIPITISSTILSSTRVIDMTMILSRLAAIGYTEKAANAMYGSYSTMAVSMYNFPTTLINAISLPLVPLLTSAVESKDVTKQKSIISSAFKMTALIAFPTGLGISVFSKPILNLMFSAHPNEIEYTAPLLSLLGLSIFLSAMITLTNSVLQAYKKVNKPIISMIVGTLVKIITSFILIGIEEINIYGAPISTFFSTLSIVAINLYFIIKETGKIYSVYKIFGKSFISAILSITAGVGIYLALSQQSDSKALILPVIAIVALIYVFFILLLKGINKDEILMLPKGKLIYNILDKFHLI